MTPHTEFGSNDMLHLLDDLEKYKIDTGANTSSDWVYYCNYADMEYSLQTSYCNSCMHKLIYVIVQK
jgi:hypothetical protein